MPVSKSCKEMLSKRSFAELNFVESKTELLLIQEELSRRHMKTRLIEIGKDLEPESRDLGINRLGLARSSCDGFLLIHKPKDNGELQVINPTKKICITIPKCPCKHKHNACSAAIGFLTLRRSSIKSCTSLLILLVSKYLILVALLVVVMNIGNEFLVHGKMIDHLIRLIFSGRIQCQ
ncbi:hypothetical protein FXO38_23141 [Capsicum annuum]|nr:hypothetical protein FXO38_23141 [Capsicum annuum]